MGTIVVFRKIELGGVMGNYLRLTRGVSDFLKERNHAYLGLDYHCHIISFNFELLLL